MPADVIGLPPGITVTFIDQPSNVAIIYIGGTPTASGPYSISVNVNSSNGGGGCVSQSSTIFIRSGVIPTDCATPMVTSTISPNMVAGSSFVEVFDILVSNATAASVSGLPPGFTTTLDINGGLLRITGAPNPAGIYPLTVNLTNNCTSGPDAMASVSGGTLTIT